MSSQKKINNQDVISHCIFCGVAFGEGVLLGDKVSCPLDQGGCGNDYRISMYQQPAVKQADD